MKQNVISLFLLIAACLSTRAQQLTGALGERFTSRIIAKQLSDPWEITYGPDNHLWVTEAKGYRVSRINPETGERKVLLDLANQRSFPRYDKTPDEKDGGKPWPQGGLMGLALHPQLLNGKPFVYLIYVYNYLGANSAGDGGLPNWSGFFYTGRIVRYQYNAEKQSLSDPLIVCDSIPQSSDHNGGRLVIAQAGNKEYLFYSVGDMGAGQFDNGGRTNYAQDVNKYEGKILRFNTEPDSDKGRYDRWIPNDNPFNSVKQNAVWTYGHRNPQGLAYAIIGGKGYLYSSEHGPFSDDEINIIEKGRNYGHPLIIGYCDNNYNGYAAAVSERLVLPGPWHTTYPLIMSETANAAKIGANIYRDPIKSFYPASKDLLSKIFKATKEGQENKPEWPAVAPSGMAVYTSPVIPGWKNSLLVTSLKEGRIVRLKLNSRGDGVTGDTLSYFKAKARYRDIALSADGTKLYLATDSSSVTSGPSGEDPHGSSLRGSIIELTWQKVADTSVEKAERIDRRRPDKALRKGSRSRTLSYKGR